MFRDFFGNHVDASLATWFPACMTTNCPAPDLHAIADTKGRACPACTPETPAQKRQAVADDRKIARAEGRMGR